MSDGATHRPNRVLAGMRRVPGTLTMIALILVVGVVWQGLWRPFEESDLFDVVAYGLPAFEAGRWWTPLTGTFFVNQPWVYVFTITGFAGMAYLEFRRGSRIALAYYWVGQLFAIFATALLLWGFSQLPWAWAETQAAALDVGASGGTMACVAAAIGLFRSPWRVRAWLVLLGFVFIAMLFWGTLADLEHLLAVLLVLFVDRSLRVQRTTIREQRLIAFIAVLVLGAVQIVTILVPTDGPFGPTEPASGGFVDFAVDTVVILVVANGLRRGRRWSWVVAVILAAINVLTALLVLVVIIVTSEAQLEATIDGETELALASGAMWLLMLVYLILVRRAFRARRRSTLGRQPAPEVDDVKRMLQRRRRRHAVVDDHVGGEQLRAHRRRHRLLPAPRRRRPGPRRPARAGRVACGIRSGVHPGCRACRARPLLLQRRRGDAGRGAGVVAQPGRGR